MSIIFGGRRFLESKYSNEKEFEDEIMYNSKTFFGKSTVLINAKKKIESKSLGGAVPDGFLFDFGDPSDPQFYIVEVELSEHSFYNHVFPQITKFFAFFNNTKLQKSLVDKLFSVVNTDEILRNEFKKYLGQQEIYKFLSDIIESSQNILLIADAPIIELREITDTYTDTWGKLVRFQEIKKFSSGNERLHSITPDFETIQYAETPQQPEDAEESEEDKPKYTEEYHLEGVNQSVKEIYNRIKEVIGAIDNTLLFNPQKYYVSIRSRKNIAFLKISKKKLRLIAMMPEEEIRKAVATYPVIALSQPVQDFYNGPCAAVDINNLDNLTDLETLLVRLVAYHQNSDANGRD